MTASSHVVGVIPARWASTRLPGKSLVEIAGKPLILHVLDRVRQARRLNAVIVATDDDRIRRVVEEAGGIVVMTREDHPSGTDRVAEAVAAYPADIVINIQGDEPLVDPSLIDRLAGVMIDHPQWDMGTAAAPILERDDLHAPSVVKVVTGEAGQALYFSRAPIPYARDGFPLNPSAIYRRHIGIYAYRRPFLELIVATPPTQLEEIEKLEQLRALAIGARMVVIETNDIGIGVDTPADVATVERLLAGGAGGGED
ncbi:MAG: 3-deoxy-manno-octulosonate cytidylyltransferase [Lentisphaerae bacterium]|nr:3-deoxy-manno-octulosonate cytidylyltransferase [Lentisphaerota bacterium]